MTTSISSDILAIIALCFTIFLAKRNMIVDNYKNSIYVSVAQVTIILILLEISTVLMEASGKSTVLMPLTIVNILGFSLSPVMPFILLHFNSKRANKKMFMQLLALPLYINALICILDFKTGWIFSYNAQNQYERGNLFLIPTFISMFYFVLMIRRVFLDNADNEIYDKTALIPILFLPVIGLVVQLLFKNVLLIWGSVSISLLLYYIFLRELQFNYDIQTGIRNRVAFTREMEKYLRDDRNAAIIVIDINDLKKTNDLYGHKAGDEMIVHAARAISESFSGIGKAFRIGGDEFCVICKETSEAQTESALKRMEQMLIEMNQKKSPRIVLAHGYANHVKDGQTDIYAAFAEADKAMYTHKAKLKGLYGRRAEDQIVQ